MLEPLSWKAQPIHLYRFNLEFIIYLFICKLCINLHDKHFTGAVVHTWTFYARIDTAISRYSQKALRCMRILWIIIGAGQIGRTFDNHIGRQLLNARIQYFFLFMFSTYSWVWRARVKFLSAFVWTIKQITIIYVHSSNQLKSVKTPNNNNKKLRRKKNTRKKRN